jgi:SpoIID/LytB domain protein
MGEVRDPGWPQAALRTQAIAARTYALRSTGGELCDYDRCQVYLGAGAEYGAMDRAVSDSRGQVVTYGGGLATTVYSANGGGFSATAAEGFGAGSANYPYLKAAPYTTKDPDPWTVRIALSDLAARFGAAGALQGAHIAQAGPSGRALSVSLDGTSGPTIVDGHRFASGLGLRSTLFTVRIEQQDVAPPAPAPADLIQVPPDQLGVVTPADPAPVEAAAPTGPVKLIIPGGGSGRLKWIGLAVLLIPAWALAATYYGYGVVPAEVRRTVLSLFGRAGPPVPPT